jgi:HEPN domain-containing protein
MKDKQTLIDEWIKIAIEDLLAARLLLENHTGLNRAIAYHSQQYAEKMIKALLLKYDIAIKRTHNLDELLYLLREVIEISDEMIEDATNLSGYAVEIRYPDTFEPTRDEVLSAYNLSIKLIDSLNLKSKE